MVCYTVYVTGETLLLFSQLAVIARFVMKFYYGIVPASHLNEPPSSDYKPDGFIIRVYGGSEGIHDNLGINSPIVVGCVIDDIYVLREDYWLSEFSGDHSAISWFERDSMIDQLSPYNTPYDTPVLVAFSESYMKSF